MGRSQETNNKKSVRNKKEKKKKDKEARRNAKKENSQGGSSLDDMIAYVDENGNITSTPPDPDQKEEVELDDIEISVPKDESREKLDPIRKGVVTYFNDAKGFGFIKDAELKEDVFVHVNSMVDDIREGHTVTFEVEMGNKGPYAVNVKLHKER